MNFHQLLNWPDVAMAGDNAVYVWPPFTVARFAYREAEVSRLRGEGFDFIRLTVDPGVFIATVEPEPRATLEATLIDRVRRLQTAGMSVLVDLHPTAVNPRFAPERLLDAAQGDLFEAYRRMVARLAVVLAPYTAEGLAFEMMNEPHFAERDEVRRWQPMLEALHAAARAAAPGLTLVLSGADWSSAAALTRLDIAPFHGSDVIYTFHYYDPHTFTHQGADFDEARYLSGLRWPPDPAQAEVAMQAAAGRIAASPLGAQERTQALSTTSRLLREYLSRPSAPATIQRDFDAVASWARDQGVAADRVLLGEFGRGYGPDKLASVRTYLAAWEHAVVAAAQRCGFGWAVWNYEGPLPDDFLHALGMNVEP